MGAYVNDKGQLDFRRGAEANGKSYISPDLLRKASQMARDVGGTTVKAAVVGGVGVSTGAAITSAGIPAAGGALGAAVAGAAVAEAMGDKENEVIDSTPLEKATGGENYETILKQYASAGNEFHQISGEAIEDPFEAARACLGEAGFSNVEETFVNTSCLPQNASRQQTRGFSLN